jgi:hypothetical protein
MRCARDCFVIEHLRLASGARTAERRSAGRRTSEKCTGDVMSCKDVARKGELAMDRNRVLLIGGAAVLVLFLAYLFAPGADLRTQRALKERVRTRMKLRLWRIVRPAVSRLNAA